MEEEKKWLNVDDVVSITGVSKSMAYLIMRRCNQELKKEGKITVQGKVSAKKFFEMIE